MNTQTAVIYARISKDDEGTGAGVQRQEAECRELAARLGLEVAAVYVDNSVSAYSGKRRPQYEAMLAALRDGSHGSVIVWAVDRLYRRVQDLESLVTAFDAAGVQVHAVKSGDIDLTTADGRLHARLLGSVAQHESEKKAERLRSMARQRATVELRTPTPRRPLGYRWAEPNPVNPLRPREGSTAGLEIDPEVAPAIRQAYEDLDQGLSLGATYRRLREAIGDKAPTTAGGLGQSLRSPRYAGLATYRGQITGKASNGLPIVPEDLWRRVHAILTDPARKRGQNFHGREPRTLLGGGLFICHRCGGNMAAGNKRATSGDKGMVPVYACSGHSHLTRRRERLEAAVIDAVARALNIMGAAGALDVPADDEAPEVTVARERLAELQEREAEAGAAYATGALSLSMFTAASQTITAEKVGLERVIAGASRRPGVESLAALGSRAGDHWRGLLESDPERAKGILRQVLTRIDTTPDVEEFRLTWALPGDPPETLRVARRPRRAA